MPDFKDLVKNLYKTKNRELSQEKFDYIIKTYSGKEEDFVKNFYKTVGEDLTQDKLNYIKSSYLTPQPENSKKKVPTSESTPSVVSSGGKNDWKSSVYGGLKESSRVTQKPVEAKQPQKAVEKKFHEDDRNFIEKTTDVIVESIVSGALQVGSGVTGLVGGVADSLIKKKDLDKEYTPLSNEWFYGLIAQKGEVENPSWYSNQGIRDAMMNASSKLAQAASMEAEVAKESIGVKDTGKQTIDHVLDGNYGEAGKSLVVDVIQQVPNLSIVALSGGSAGLATMGATSAGSSLQEEYAKDQDISAVDMAQSLTNGIVEVVSEKMFDLDIKAARKLGGKLSDYLGESGKIIKDKIAQEGSEAVSKEIVRGLGDVIKSSAKGAGQEVLEENIVTVADFLVSSIDEDNLNEEGFSKLLKDMGQTALVAAGSGGSVSGLSALASQQKLTIEEKTAITNLKDVANNKDLSKETRALAKEKIKSIYKEANQKATETYSKVSELPVEDVVDIIKRQKEIEQLEADKSSVSDVDMVDEIDAKINEKQESIRVIMNGKDNGEFTTPRTEAELEQTTEEVTQEPIQEITVGKGNKKVNIEEAASKSELTPEQAAQKSQDMAIAVEAEMKKQRKDPLWRRLQKGIFNRKANLDSAFSDTQEGELAKAAHENISGYKSIADDIFVAARDYIYGGEGIKWSKDLPFGLKFEGDIKLTPLNPELRSSLDEMIFHRRVINVDSNRDSKKLKVEKDISNLQAELKGVKSEKEKRAIRRNIDKLKRIKTDRVANPMGFNKEESSAALLGIKERVGEEAFNDLMQRSERYFDTRRQMLEKMKEEGIISQRSVDSMIEDEYVERQFLEYVFQDQQFQSSSPLSKEQLKSLKDGSEGLTMLDTELMLHTAMRSMESKIAWNRAGRLLKEEVKNNSNVGKVAEFEVYKSKGKHVDIDGNLVDHVKGDVKVDPLTGKKMIKPAPKGYETILFFENGDVDGVYMPVKLAKEYKDVEKITTDLDPYARKLMQTGTVKFFATLTNPLFAASNFFRDFAKTIFLSDTYGANLFTAIPDLTTRFSKNALMYSAHKAGIKNEYFDKLVSDFQKYGGKFEFLHKDGKTENLYKRTISKNRGAIAKFGGQAMNLYEGVTGFAGDVTETGMRLSIFEKARNELIRQNGENISDADMEKINVLAVNKARAVMDYNKGGLATKWLDQFSPYLNAQVVGFTSDINYIVKNPKKFGAKMGQLGLMASSVVLYSLMNMDEEEYENIPDYIKNNFFIFPLAKKEGEPRKFLRFPKYQGIQPFSALFEQATIAAYNQLNGTNYGSSTSTSTRVADVLETWSPVPMSFNGLVQKLPPTVNASLAYAMNYDSFRDSYVSYEKNLGLKPSVEGLKDENVARFYKVIGAASEKAFGVEDALSPKRLQVATEKIITTPSTNFIIGQIYGIADWLTQSYELPIETETSKSVGTLAGAAKSKFIREIDMEYAQKQRMAKGTLGMELRSEKFIKKTQTEAMVDAGLDPVQIREEIEKIADDPMEKERLLKSAENYWKKDALEKENLPFYRVAKGVNSYFGGSVEDKAELTYEKLGGIDPNSEDFRDYVNTAIRMKMVSPKKTKGVSTLDRFLKRYNDIYNQSQSE